MVLEIPGVHFSSTHWAKKKGKKHWAKKKGKKNDRPIGDASSYRSVNRVVL